MKVTSELTTVVCVSIKGEVQDGDHLKIHNDAGLVRKFLEFIREREIYPAIREGHSGGGSYCGFFDPEDAKTIRRWLRAQGVTELSS